MSARMAMVNKEAGMGPLCLRGGSRRIVREE